MPAQTSGPLRIFRSTILRWLATSLPEDEWHGLGLDYPRPRVAPCGICSSGASLGFLFLSPERRRKGTLGVSLRSGSGGAPVFGSFSCPVISLPHPVHPYWSRGVASCYVCYVPAFPGSIMHVALRLRRADGQQDWEPRPDVRFFL